MIKRKLITAERKTLAARNLFQEFIDVHECYDGQLSCCVASFRRELMIPILDLIKSLEDKADE